jgi:predicted acyltransferase
MPEKAKEFTTKVTEVTEIWWSNAGSKRVAGATRQTVDEFWGRCPSHPQQRVRWDFGNVARGGILMGTMAKPAPPPVVKQRPPVEKPAGRLLALDAFRGLTILAMILVNNPGSWGDQYWPLAHAEWHGWTPTDLIFPFFLFIVGTALAYSLRRFRDGERIRPAVYWRIVRRTALLMFLGWMPFLLLETIGAVRGESFDLSSMRLPGVLVRIAIVYFFTSLIVLHIPLRGQIVLGIILLLGYWAALAFLPNLGEYERNLSHEGNVVGWVDRAVLGPNHMYSGDRVTDPEGLLSTLPAIVTALFGYWTGLFIQRRGLNYEMVLILLGCGAICVEVALLWNFALPINKKIWTSSYVLLSGGLAMQLLAGCLLKFDLWGWRRVARPFEVVGVNAIFVFVASGLLSIGLSNWMIQGVTAKAWIYNNLFTSWITDPKLASLAFALAIVAFWWLMCWILWRLGWTIRV